MGWIRRHWPSLLGWIALGYQAIKFIIGLLGDIDFILSRLNDPGWVAVMFSTALNSPQWVNVLLIASGLALIYWDTRRKKVGAPDSDLPPFLPSPVTPIEQSWKTKIPDIRAAESSSVRQLFGGQERRKLVGLLRSGDITAWAHEKGRIDPAQLEPRLWHLYELEFDEIDGNPQTLFRHPSEQKTRPWKKIQPQAELTRMHDVYFNRAQLHSHWPDLFK